MEGPPFSFLFPTFIFGNDGKFGSLFCFLGMMVTLVTSQNWSSKTKKKEKEKKPLLLLLDGIDGLKNRSEGRGGGTNGCLKRKVFKKNQKHQPNIVEITHLCIMHGAHTSLYRM